MYKNTQKVPIRNEKKDNNKQDGSNGNNFLVKVKEEFVSS